MGSKKRAATRKDPAMGLRIKKAREALGVSVGDLGYAYGGTKGSRQRVQFWERGENFPPAADLPRLCQLLNIDANHLLGTPSVSSSARDLNAARERLLNLSSQARRNEADAEADFKSPKKRRAG